MINRAMPSRIVTTHYRYKRPPRKRKAVPLEGPAIVVLAELGRSIGTTGPRSGGRRDRTCRGAGRG